MNWSKVKNIMILILVIINLFLIVDIGLTSFMSASLPKGTGENFKRVLYSRGIEIDDKLVPKYYETRKTLTGEFYDIDYLTKIFIGESVSYISDGKNVIAQKGDKKLIVSGTSFEYTAPGQAEDKNGKKIIAAIKKIGLSTFGAAFVQDEGLVRVYADGALVEGVYLDVTLSESGEIIYLKGVWPNLRLNGEEERLSVIKATNEICNVLSPKAHIDNIEKVYFLEETGKKCTITPGWKIFADGKSYIVS